MIRFEDYFKDNENNWLIKNTKDVLLKIKENAYVFEHKRSHSAWYTYNVVNKINWVKDYTIEAVIEWLNGENNYGFGIIWNLDEDNEYRYVINKNGYYRVLFKEGDNWHFIIDWTYSPYIKQRNFSNKLTIIRKGKNVNFYINDKYLTRRSIKKFNKHYDNFIGFVIDYNTKIKIHSIIVRDDANHKIKPIIDNKKQQKEDNVSLESLKKELNALIGLENIKQEIETLSNFIKIQKEREKFNLPLSNKSFHMVFMGPPGTGKTTIARLIAKIYYKLGVLKKGHIVEVDRAGLVAEWIGQTAIKVEEKIKEAEGGVLFIDEAYTLYNEAPNDFGREAIQVIVKRMEDNRTNLIVIVAGYEEEMRKFLKSNPGLKSRFNKYFYFEHYFYKDLVLIFKKFLSDSGYEVSPKGLQKVTDMIKIAYYSKDKNFGNARYVRNIFEKSIENQANRLIKETKFTKNMLMEITEDDIPSDYFEFE